MRKKFVSPLPSIIELKRQKKDCAIKILVDGEALIFRLWDKKNGEMFQSFFPKFPEEIIYIPYESDWELKIESYMNKQSVTFTELIVEVISSD